MVRFSKCSSRLTPNLILARSDFGSRLAGESGDSLARKSFDTLDRGVRIIVHKMLFNGNRAGAFTVAANNIVIFLWVDGEQYSGRKISSMPREASFRKIEVMPTFGYWSIVTASAHNSPLGRFECGWWRRPIFLTQS